MPHSLNVMILHAWVLGVCSLQANPHKRLRHLYGARMMTQYRGIPLGELSPHVYAIAEQVMLYISGKTLHAHMLLKAKYLMTLFQEATNEILICECRPSMP